MPVDDDALGPDSFEYDDDFVPALFARDEEEAEEYCELLADHDIPSRLGTDDEALDDDEEHRKAGRRGMTHGVPVLVPETLLDEASEVIADREDFGDFEESDEDEDDEEEDEDFAMQEFDGEDGSDVLDDDEDETSPFEDDDELDGLEDLGEDGDEYF